MRLFAVWASVIPTTARTSQRQSSPGLPTASRAATRPDTRVIGSTAARVTTSHRVTASTGPSGGGLVVRSAYAHDLSREPPLTSGMGRGSHGALGGTIGEGCGGPRNFSSDPPASTIPQIALQLSMVR